MISEVTLLKAFMHLILREKSSCQKWDFNPHLNLETRNPALLSVKSQNLKRTELIKLCYFLLNCIYLIDKRMDG